MKDIDPMRYKNGDWIVCFYSERYWNVLSIIGTGNERHP